MRRWAFVVAVVVAATGCISGAHAAAEKRTAWVKLCENGRCRLMQDRMDGKTGAILYTAEVHGVGGSGRKVFVLTVPRGMVNARGVSGTVYTKLQWQRLYLKQSVGREEIRAFNLKSLPCNEQGCSGETEATQTLIKEMRDEGGMMMSFTEAGAMQGYPIPLEGFAQAWDGPPIDAAVYMQRRQQVMEGVKRGTLTPSGGQPVSPDMPPPLTGYDGMAIPRR